MSSKFGTYFKTIVKCRYLKESEELNDHIRDFNIFGLCNKRQCNITYSVCRDCIQNKSKIRLEIGLV